jgi:hypothetical protein
MHMAAPLVQLEHISQIYGAKKQRVTALQDVNIRLHEGELGALLGPYDHRHVRIEERALCLRTAGFRLIRAILTQFSDNSTDSPCTQHGHHSGHNQPVFPWFHDLLQRRNQVVQCRRDGSGGGVFSTGRLNSRNASFFMGANDSTHSATSFRLVPSIRGALVRLLLWGCATPLSQGEQAPCQGLRGSARK